MPTTESLSPQRPSSMQPIVRSRVLPRVSFRAMILLTTVAAILATVARSAGDGATLAKAMMFGVAAVFVFFVLASMAFFLSWLTAKLVIGKFDNAREGNPFAADQLPPQLLKPREPEQ